MKANFRGYMSFKWRPPTDQERITILEERMESVVEIQEKVDRALSNAEQANSEHRETKATFRILISVIIGVGAILLTAFLFIRAEMLSHNEHLDDKINRIEKSVQKIQDK